VAWRLKPRRPAACGDANAAQDWYDDAAPAPGFGEAFTDELLSVLAFLLEHSSVGSRRYAHLLLDESQLVPRSLPLPGVLPRER
jgi:toxin ParE1/3/4